MATLKKLVTICQSLMLLMTSSISALEEYDVPQLREMTQEGVVTHDYIMNLVMMGLPADLLTKIKGELRAAGGSPGTGFQSPTFGAPTLGQVPGAVTGQSHSSNNSSSDSSPDVPNINNIDSNEPILLNGRRKRSFDNTADNPEYDESIFGTGGFGTGFDAGFGGTGFGSKGFDSGFGSKGFNDPTTIHPGGLNGNLYGGNARSFIQYPGTFTNKGSFNSFNKHHVPFGGGGSFDCPRQVDQGFPYLYSPDPALYPAVPIANELFARSLPGSDLLFQCLQRQVVFPTDPPQIFTDPFILTANATCQNIELQVWSYQSQLFTGRCWPLVNFQEVPFYKTCLNRFCKCKSNNDFFSSFGYGHQNNRANVCITEYETLSLWSYCEQLIPNRRIVRDRIIVPDACTCSTVDCFPTGFHRK